MIKIKTKEEIENQRIGGHMLAEVLFETLAMIKPGVSELEVDKFAENLILKKGGEPGFKKVYGYKHTICVATNDVVVHGIPTNYRFKDGDIVGIDCGVFYKGLHTDMAETIIVGNATGADKERKERLLQHGKDALLAGIAQAKAGNHVGDISKAMQDIIEKQGSYSVVHELVGHGVGKDLHEEPEIPGFLNKPIEKTPLLKENMVIAIEIIYNEGKRFIAMDDDEWTIRTDDGSLAGLFERSLLVTKNGPVILTK